MTCSVTFNLIIYVLIIIITFIFSFNRPSWRRVGGRWARLVFNIAWGRGGEKLCCRSGDGTVTRLSVWVPVRLLEDCFTDNAWFRRAALDVASGNTFFRKSAIVFTCNFSVVCASRFFSRILIHSSNRLRLFLRFVILARLVPREAIVFRGCHVGG
jgi:hypothetical protein